ncbi:tyrosine-type recombinase/integrase [Noviherbaspirillum sp.]|uniref:tyrosine-type recombinase/integrase n=1 Tax=Noviherbaspirillum sp. TaxID=1926288 RepID=UPI002FE368D6
MPKLTKRIIDKLEAPPSGQSFCWDDEIKGFGVRVTASTKSFILDRKFNGRSIRLTIGRYPAWSEEQARKQANKLIVQLDQGIDPREERQKAQTDAVTLEAAFQRFISERQLKPRTAYDYNRYMRGVVQSGKPQFFSDWQNKPIASITEDMIASRYAKLKDGARGAAQASSAMRVLRSVLNYAIQAYNLDIRNPVSTLTKRRAWVKINKRRTHLHHHEIRPFVLALRKLPNPVMAAYLEFVLLTGARRNEAAQLKWADVNDGARVLTFTDTKKNGEDRSIPITSRVHEILDAMKRLKMGDYVFASTDKAGKATHVSEPRKALARANSAAGTNMTVHDLRRTFATVLESLDCPMAPLKALLGHSMAADVTTGHYVVIGIERLRPWSDRYDAHLRQLIDTDPATRVVELKAREA